MILSKKVPLKIVLAEHPQTVAICDGSIRVEGVDIAFGAQRMAWYSNLSATSAILPEVLATAKAALQSLVENDREWTFGRTALQLYPAPA